LEHSVGHILATCMQEVLYESGYTCGEATACGTNGIMIVDYRGATTCLCVENPGPRFDPADNDCINQSADNCPAVANADQADGVGDGVGDACDNCANRANADQANGDADTLGNACDNCPGMTNEDQADDDKDRIGNVCDICPNHYGQDPDRDGICDDNCPYTFNPQQNDADQDGLGDACDKCDIVRGIAYGCKERWFEPVDARLECIAEIFRDRGYDSPWGSWEPATPCRIRSESHRRTEFGCDRARALATQLEGRALTESDIVDLLIDLAPREALVEILRLRRLERPVPRW